MKRRNKIRLGLVTLAFSLLGFAACTNAASHTTPAPHHMNISDHRLAQTVAACASAITSLPPAARPTAETMTSRALLVKLIYPGDRREFTTCLGKAVGVGKKTAANIKSCLDNIYLGAPPNLAHNTQALRETGVTATICVTHGGT